MRHLRPNEREVKVDTKHAWLTGRYGTYDLTAVSFSWEEGSDTHPPAVWINGYGQRDTILSGGIGRIEAEAMDRLCMRYLGERGYEVTPSPSSDSSESFPPF